MSNAGTPFPALHPTRRLTQIVAALAVVSLLCPRVSAASSTDLFGAIGSYHDGSLGTFTQWAGMLARSKAVTAPGVQVCTSDASGPCRLKAWRDWNTLLVGLRGKDALAQLDAVNAFMNRQPYVEDRVNWGIADYWATPLEFLEKGGDCEDFAIAKYVSLRSLGWPAKDLQIVILQDLNLGVSHAVLAAEVHGDDLILDNQIRSIVRASSIGHYRPSYAVNEEGWWSYRIPAAAVDPMIFAPFFMTVRR